MLHLAFRQAAVAEALGTPRNLTVSQALKDPLADAFYAALMTLLRTLSTLYYTTLSSIAA